MNSGHPFALLLGLASVLFVAIGTLWPGPTATIYAGNEGVLRSESTPEIAVRNLGEEIRERAWHETYVTFTNRAQFAEQDFVHDLTRFHPNLRTYTPADSYEVRPLRASDNEAVVQLKLRWSSVVGDSASTRDLRVMRYRTRWEPEWPLQKEPMLAPQVIPANYLRWDVVYRGSGDDWGAEDVEAPDVRIIDMHPVERVEGLVILGELLNEDVVPASVSVTASLLSKKDQSPISTEGSFDKISHLLLPKQVTPFLITFPNVSLSDVGSIRMTPSSSLISASADPVIQILDERLNPAPDPSVTGELTNQSGQIVNVAHVLTTFYDKTGQVVWVADQYADRALLPQTPVPFDIHIPEDLAGKISTERTVVATFSSGGTR